MLSPRLAWSQQDRNDIAVQSTGRDGFEGEYNFTCAPVESVTFLVRMTQALHYDRTLVPFLYPHTRESYPHFRNAYDNWDAVRLLANATMAFRRVGECA